MLHRKFKDVSHQNWDVYPNWREDGGSESGPQRWPPFAFTQDWDTFFGRRAVVEFDFVVRQGWHGVAGLLSFAIADAKKSPESSAFSCVLFT